MMFRDKSISKLYAFALAAVFALTLAGCGGGGTAAMDDDGDMPTMPDPPATCDPGYTGTPPNCEPERTPQQTCEGAGGRYETDGMCTSAEDRITEAARNSCVAAGGRFEADGMCTSASAVAQETCEGDGGRYEMNGSCTSSEDVATETCIAGGGRSNADGSCTSAGDLATTKSAGTKAEAIGDEAGQETDVDLPTDYTVAIERDRDGTTVKITDPANDDDDDKKFEDQMADLGDGRSMHVRTMDANDDGDVEQEVSIIATDIKAPEARPFGIDGDNKGVYVLDQDTDDENEGNEAHRVTVDTAAKLKSAEFVSAGKETELTFAAAVEDNANTMDVDETVKAFEADATLDGASGKLKCVGTADCTVTLNDKGAVTATTGDWNFTPADGEMVYVADTDYLYYGFWLMRTTDKDGVTEYDEVQTFFGAKDVEATATSNIGDVVGAATYKGGATGVYVKNVTDDQGAVFTATSGHFSADVELNASFGGGNVADNNQFTIGGTIKDFQLQHDEENDWEVSLGLADLSGGRTDGGEPGKAGPGSSHTNVFDGATTGDSTSVKGTWNGAFYGSSAAVDHDMDDTTPDINPAPPSVLGEFNANFTDGTAAGAFGANKK